MCAVLLVHQKNVPVHSVYDTIIPPSYSPDFGANDYFLSSKVKKWLGEKDFSQMRGSRWKQMSILSHFRTEMLEV